MNQTTLKSSPWALIRQIHLDSLLFLKYLHTRYTVNIDNMSNINVFNCICRIIPEPAGINQRRFISYFGTNSFGHSSIRNPETRHWPSKLQSSRQNYPIFQKRAAALRPHPPLDPSGLTDQGNLGLARSLRKSTSPAQPVHQLHRFGPQ